MFLRRKKKKGYTLNLTAAEMITLREVLTWEPQGYHQNADFREVYYKVEQEARRAQQDNRDLTFRPRL